MTEGKVSWRWSGVYTVDFEYIQSHQYGQVENLDRISSIVSIVSLEQL